jgi:hypothetical protein
VHSDVHEFLGHLTQLGLVDGASEADGTADTAVENGWQLPRDAGTGSSFSLDTLWVDWFTAQVIDALRARGIEAILMKGPAIKGWLYRDCPSERGYLDADLLIADESFGATTTVLSELGFRREDGMEANNLCATTWRRDADGAVVDLHSTLQGCEHSRIDPWPVLRADAVEEQVGGTSVLLPSIPARAAQLVLVSPADRPWRRWDDLARALEQLPTEGWRDAAAVARALGVERLFGYRLSQTPAGAACAERIGVSTARPWWLRWEDDPILCWIGWLAALPSWRARARLARQLLLPTPVYVRLRDPAAARRGLAAAYAAWALHVLRLLPGATATLVRSVRRAVSRRR